MLFGYKPEGGPDLVSAIKQKVFIEKLKVDFEVGHFRAEKIGRSEPDKVQPIKITLSSFMLRNQILQLGSNLPRGPKGLKIEKCLPKEYRPKSKELLHLGWKLKQAKKNTIKTMVVLLGHLLCLQIKKKDEGDIKYDWVIHKEWFPPQGVLLTKRKFRKTELVLHQPLC
jgi:hypothetical protein